MRHTRQHDLRSAISTALRALCPQNTFIDPVCVTQNRAYFGPAPYCQIALFEAKAAGRDRCQLSAGV
jgi:hypothetical protein